MPEDESGEVFPDRVARRRAAGHEIVDAHDFIDRSHLVEQQRQFGVVGTRRSLALGVGIDLRQHVADRRDDCACAGRPPLMAQAPTATRILQLARNSRSTCTFSALHTPPSIRRDIAGAAMLDVGERRAVELDDLGKIEQPLVDVEQRHVAAEAAGERRCRELDLYGRSCGGLTPYISALHRSYKRVGVRADRHAVETALADRHGKADALEQDRADRADMRRLVGERERRCRPACRWAN